MSKTKMNAECPVPVEKYFAKCPTCGCSNKGGEVCRWCRQEAESQPQPAAIPSDLLQLYEDSKRCGAGSFSGDHISPLIERIGRAEAALTQAREQWPALLEGLDEYWVTLPEGKAVVESMRAALAATQPKEGK